MPTPVKPEENAKALTVKATGEGALRSVYVNSAQFQMTPWDITIRFGEVLGRDGNELLVEEKACVVMSPQHAKAMLELLQENLADFERRAGEIRWKQSG